MKYLISILLSTLLFTSVNAQIETQQINWVTLDQLEGLEKTEKRPIIIDFYTDWCGYCKLMDKKTFSKPKVIEYINSNFYAVKFNAESKETHTFFGVAYGSEERYHNFARATLKQGSFPTVGYFDSFGNLIELSPGYKPAGKLLTEMKKVKD